MQLDAVLETVDKIIQRAVNDTFDTLFTGNKTVYALDNCKNFESMSLNILRYPVDAPWLFFYSNIETGTIGEAFNTLIPKGAKNALVDGTTEGGHDLAHAVSLLQERIIETLRVNKPNGLSARFSKNTGPFSNHVHVEFSHTVNDVCQKLVLAIVLFKP